MGEPYLKRKVRDQIWIEVYDDDTASMFVQFTLTPETYKLVTGVRDALLAVYPENIDTDREIFGKPALDPNSGEGKAI